MASHGRTPFKAKVPFRKKVDDTWYRLDSNESTEILHTHLPLREDEQEPILYGREISFSDHEKALVGEEYDRNVPRSNHDQLDGSQHYAPSEASGISRHYAHSISSRGENSQYYAQSAASVKGNSPNYHPSDASGISRHYARSVSSRGEISQHYDANDKNGMHEYNDLPSALNLNQAHVDDAPREIMGISKYFSSTPSEISGISRHYAQSEMSEISKDYAHSDASGISKHYNSDASGITKHYGELSENERSVGDVSRFYDDFDTDPGDEFENQSGTTKPKKEPTIGDELSKFSPPKQKKKSRFQYPEVSRLWFFQQNKDEYNESVSDEDNEQLTRNRLQPHQFQSVPSEESDAGDDVVFDPKDKDSGIDVAVKLVPNDVLNAEIGDLSPGRTLSTADTNGSPPPSPHKDMRPSRTITFTTNSSLLTSSIRSSSILEKRKLSKVKKMMIGTCLVFFFIAVVVVTLIILWVYKGFPNFSRGEEKALTSDNGSTIGANDPAWVRLTPPPTESPPNESGSEDIGDFVELLVSSKDEIDPPKMIQSEFPTLPPSIQSSRFPSLVPFGAPSGFPSSQPTPTPSNFPSSFPSIFSSISPSTSWHPTNNPTIFSSHYPSFYPSASPTLHLSSSPTSRPSEEPTFQPSKNPTTVPSLHPSSFPSLKPTFESSVQPSISPLPSPAPTEASITNFYVTSGRFSDSDTINPYRPAPFVKELRNLPDDTDFFIHLGDFNSPELTSCKADSYAQYRKLLDNSPVLALMVLGEKDYPDCPNPVGSRILWNTYFGGIEKQWRNGDIFVERMETRSSNFAFVRRRMLFFSISFYYSKNELDSLTSIRDNDNLKWVQDRVKSHDGEFDMMVFFGNDAPFDDHYDGLFSSLESDVFQFFPVPILYIYRSKWGKNKLSNKEFNLKNIWSLQVVGRSLPFMRVTADLDDKWEPFSFEIDGKNW